jgi:serine/threonine-protein kinase RIO1
MIDVKQAVEIAKAKALEMLQENSTNLEEIERDSYKARDVWSITLSVPRDVEKLPAIARLAAEPLQYKRFLIDAETGELLAMKLRETAASQ